MKLWMAFPIVASLLISTGWLAAETNVPLFLTGREPQDPQGPLPPERWSATENVAWKTDLPGLGWSSPVVWNDRVFLTTVVDTGTRIPPRKGLYLEDLDANKYTPEQDEHLWEVYCLNLHSGEIVWKQLAHRGIPAKPHHIKNTLASETAATDGERVYVLFGNLGLFCYDLDGELQWQFAIEPRETRYGWGTSMSPIVHEDRVYLVNDNEQQSSLIALDKHSGDVVWEVARDEKTNYSTPFVWTNPLRTEIVISGINWTTSYDLAGKELWKIKSTSILAIPTPFERFGLLYVTSGHVVWGDNRIYAIRPGGQGDLTPEEGKPLGKHLAWHLKAGPYHPTPLIVGDQLYMLLDRGIMVSYNAHTGEEIYPRKRIPRGRAFTSSPWTYNDKVFCINEDGVTFALQTGPEFKVLYTNELAEDDMCMATPVIVDDRLLIRTSSRVYCIKQGATLSGN